MTCRLTVWGMWVVGCGLCLLLGCGSDSTSSKKNPDGDSDTAESDTELEVDCEPDSDSSNPDIPDDIPPLINTRPFTIERSHSEAGPSPDEISVFTRDFSAFFKNSDYFRWLSRYSQGLPEDNKWGQPGYKVWWTNAYATKHDGLVTISWERPSDNSTAKIARALAPMLGLWLATNDETTRELALGYMRGLSVTYDGMIWDNEDPVVDSIMARCIFHRNYQTELDGGRQLAMDYDSVRYEIIERRHDTLHNPANPTWGDIYVRNKRSKDDFPYLYRSMPWLIRSIWESDDAEMRAAAIKLLRQVRAMAADIVEHGYLVRTKDGDGVPFIPQTEGGLVDDFASLVSYEPLFPNAECNAKLSTAYLAAGNRLDNECIHESVEFYGDGGTYEDLAIGSHFWSSNMIWGYHLTAVAVALAFDDAPTARKLLDGLATRIEGLMVDERAAKNTEWWPDVAQLLVQAAAYGLPLTGDEARLIQTQYLEATEHYNSHVPWDPWDASVPDDTPYPVLPDRNQLDGAGAVLKTYVRITEILNLFEYCASPLKAETGASFVDCARLLDPERWGTDGLHE